MAGGPRISSPQSPPLKLCNFCQMPLVITIPVAVASTQLFYKVSGITSSLQKRRLVASEVPAACLRGCRLHIVEQRRNEGSCVFNALFDLDSVRHLQVLSRCLLMSPCHPSPYYSSIWFLNNNLSLLLKIDDDFLGKHKLWWIKKM